MARLHCCGGFFTSLMVVCKYSRSGGPGHSGSFAASSTLRLTLHAIVAIASAAAPPTPSRKDEGIRYELRYYVTQEQAQQGSEQKRGLIEMNDVRNVVAGAADDERGLHRLS